MGQDYLSNYSQDFTEIEKRHFWYVARSYAFEKILKRITSVKKFSSCLEVGCGSGGMLGLEAGVAERVFAIEPHSPAIEQAKKRSIDHSRVHFENISLDEYCRNKNNWNKFDFISSFDVLEHIQDHEAALEKIYALAAPGASFLMTVPASKALWSSFDIFDKHFRRYEKRELVSLVERAGFRIIQCSYFYFSTFPILWMVRKWRDWTGCDPAVQNQDVSRVPLLPLNAMLKFVLFCESRLINTRWIPWGSSLFVLAYKPQKEKVGG